MPSPPFLTLFVDVERGEERAFWTARISLGGFLRRVLKSRGEEERNRKKKKKRERGKKKKETRTRTQKEGNSISPTSVFYSFILPKHAESQEKC